jgi:hypothetical protein
MTDYWENVPQNIDDYIGFVYIIINNVNGRMYIGKKLLHKTLRKKPLKGKLRRRRFIKDSEWREYWGSCNELLRDIKTFGKQNFTRKILHCHKTRWEWSYAELQEQVHRDVLRDPIYYNGIIRIRLPAYKNGRVVEKCEIV